jgi:antitoxin ParD1/3/4
MNVSLTPELERRIAEKVESGLYTTASEVVREGLRLLFTRSDLLDQQTARLRAEIEVGLDELDRGDVAPMDAAFAEASERVAGRRRPR